MFDWTWITGKLIFYHQIFGETWNTNPQRIKNFWNYCYFLFTTSCELCSFSSYLVGIERFFPLKQIIYQYWRISFPHCCCCGLLGLSTLTARIHHRCRRVLNAKWFIYLSIHGGRKQSCSFHSEVKGGRGFKVTSFIVDYHTVCRQSPPKLIPMLRPSSKEVLPCFSIVDIRDP